MPKPWDAAVKTLKRWARRVFAAYFMTRKIVAVLRGLSEVRLDETTEEQMTKMVSYVTEQHWKGQGFLYRTYYVHTSNESDGSPWPYGLTHSYALAGLLGRIGEWLGYRYISFDASLLVQDGRGTQSKPKTIKSTAGAVIFLMVFIVATSCAR